MRLGFFVCTLTDVVVVVAGAAVVVVVVLVGAQAPRVSPCARCAATAGRAIVIVCAGCFLEPVLWQTATFSWPAPAVFVFVVLVVGVVVDVEVDVEVEVEVDVETETELDDGVVVLDVWRAMLGEEPLVICARPTPAAAAKANPTIIPTSERRLRRLCGLCMATPSRCRGFGPTPVSRHRRLKLALR
jgi:hypothetical protein